MPPPPPPPVAADLLVSVIVIGPDSFHMFSQRTPLSYESTCVKATVVHAFLGTSHPSLAFLLMMQRSTAILRHRASRKINCSVGSMSRASTMRCAFLIFTKVVTVLLKGQVVSWLGCPHRQPPLLLLLCLWPVLVGKVKQLGS